MEILQHEHNRNNILLTNDYCPNQAMINEFQTIFFTCKLTQIELAGKEIDDFIVDDGAQFLILHLKVTNITNEILTMYKDDFMITFDQDGPYEAENNFGVRNQFPDEYALKPQESKSGKLIFIISNSATKIMMT